MKPSSKTQNNSVPRCFLYPTTSPDQAVPSREVRIRAFVELIKRIVASLCLSLAVGGVILAHLGISFSWATSGLLSLATISLSVLACMTRPTRLLLIVFQSLAILGASLGGWLIPFSVFPVRLRGLVSAIQQSVLYSFAWSQPLSAPPEGYAAFVFIFTSLVSFWLWQGRPKPFWQLFFLLFPFFGAFQSGTESMENVPLLALGLLPIALTFTLTQSSIDSSRKSRFGHLFGLYRYQLTTSLGLFILLVSLILQSVLPSNFLMEPHLAEKLRQIQKKLTLPETVNYYEFSLRDAGYYPLGNPMGGALTPRDTPYMTVTGPDQPIYLRGAVAKDYTGQSWLGEEMEPNFIFDNQARVGRQANVFSYPDRLGIAREIAEKLFLKTTLEIEPLQLPIQVLFTGGRPTQIIIHSQSGSKDRSGGEASLSSFEKKSPVNAIYYNEDGQLYSGSEIEPAGYQVVGWISKDLSTAQRESLLHQGLEQGSYKLGRREPTQRYREVLRQGDPELYLKVYEHGATRDGALLKAFLDVLHYVESHYRYNLSVRSPQRTDLVEEFIETKEGYCVYFATFLALLAREMGLESRYVEGFIVPGVSSDFSQEDIYKRTVRSDSAHAWTEISFGSLGWISFDATPVDPLNSIKTDQTEQNKRQPEESSATESTKPSENSPATTPPTQTTRQTMMQTTTTTSSPQQPNPSPQASLSRPQPSNQAGNESRRPNPNLSLIFLILLVLLVITLATLFYFKRKKEFQKRIHVRQYQPRSMEESSKLSRLIWTDLESIAHLGNLDFQLSDTFRRKLMKVVEWIDSSQSDGSEWIYGSQKGYFCDQWEKYFYGQGDLSLEDWDALFRLYQVAEASLKSQLNPLDFYWKRVLFPSRLVKEINNIIG